MVTLTDVISREQFRPDMLRESTRKSVFWDGGLIQNDEELTRLMAAKAGSTFNFDYFLDLADNDSNISDDSNTDATPDGIGSATDRAVANFRNKQWGAKSITRNLSSAGDPISAIGGRVAAYWARQYDLISLSIIKGIIEGNIANDAGDMVNNQTGVATDLSMVIDTKQTAGDAQDFFGAMICHSAIKSSFDKQSIVDKIYSDQGQFLYYALTGLRLIVTDSVETGAPASGDYTSYIVGAGMIGHGADTPDVPEEVERQASTGNGGGADILHSRNHFTLHPYGFSFTGTPASTSPTLGEFEDANNWARNVDRKYIQFAALRSALA